jgi:hypothetical protein
MSSLYKERVCSNTHTAWRSGALTSELPSVLRRWQEPDCRLALWCRSLAPKIVEALDRATFAEFSSIRFTAASDEVGRKLSSGLLQDSFGATALSAALAQDMAQLVSLFVNMTGAQEVDVRLEAVRDDACRRFHEDSTLARLVTTYVGPGTVWVPAKQADEALRLQEDYSGPLHEMPRFAVGMFGGAQARGGGLVHRSPRIAATGSTRLFFCVNQTHRSADRLH